MRKRSITPTSFAFLDIMFCGFGAVVLLVMILNGDVLRKREQHSVDMRAELKRMVALESLARENLDNLTSEVQQVQLREGEVQRQSSALADKLRETTARTQAAEARTRTSQSAAARLQAQESVLRNSIGLIREKRAAEWQGGKRPVGFSGDGQRQYLTGLKLGGERTLILFDASASMLDETVVNVIRRKLLPPEVRRAAPKWQRAVRTLHWLIANLRPGKKFQVYGFNSDAYPLLPGSAGKWQATDDQAALTATINAARQITPIGGTSLYQAFEVARKMTPQPDSIIILTDGLPTQGRNKAKQKLVSAEERREMFTEAIRRIPTGLAVNTLLFPMEGDPEAAGSFWQLAVMSKGSFITPSRDWP